MRSPRAGTGKSPRSPRARSGLSNKYGDPIQSNNNLEDQDKLNSLLARKKEIQDNLNSMVTNFNVNNKKIQDANKSGPLSADQIKEI